MRQEQLVSYTSLIREAIKRELKSMNTYEECIEKSDILSVSGLWQEVMEEERMHYNKLMALLRTLDEQQRTHYTTMQPVRLRKNTRSMGTIAQEAENNFEMISHIRQVMIEKIDAITGYEELLIKLTLLPFDDLVCLREIAQQEKGHLERFHNLLIALEKESD